MGRNSQANQDAQNAGLLASGMLTSIAAGAGENIPDNANRLLDKFDGCSGLDEITSFHSMIIGAFIVFVGGGWLINELKWIPFVAGGMIAFLIAGTMGVVAVGISALIKLNTYLAMRMKARLWPVDEPNPTYGLSVTGNPLADLVLIAPFRLALFLFALPFWLIGSVYEVFRVIVGNLAGRPHISYRGDKGKYYDRVRRHYATVYHNDGLRDANEYLRLAMSGAITPLGTMIEPSEWNSSSKRNAWLAKFIKRHGPIEKYITGPAGAGKHEAAIAAGGVPNNTGGYTYDYTTKANSVSKEASGKPVSKKYSAI